MIVIGLKNFGGPGTYYIEFRHTPATEGGPPTFTRTESRNISTGEAWTLKLELGELGDPEVLTVNTRAANSTQFIETDCRVLRGTYVCDQGWG